MNEDKEPFKSDGCSMFPDLWFRHCCKDHDYAYWAGHDEFESDILFMDCIGRASKFLGPFCFFFAGCIVSGMAIGRPMYRIYQKITKAFFFWRNTL